MAQTIEQTGKKWKLYSACGGLAVWGSTIALFTSLLFVDNFRTMDDIPELTLIVWGTGLAVGFGLWGYGKNNYSSATVTLRLLSWHPLHTSLRVPPFSNTVKSISPVTSHLFFCSSAPAGV